MTGNGKAKVLVTGATGMQGGAAVQALLRLGHSVTAFVRNPSSAAAQVLAGQGVVLATGDMDDLASLEAASAGHDAVFSVQLAGVDPTDPGAEQRKARNIATAAKRAGVAQIVHTSMSGTGWRACVFGAHAEGAPGHPEGGAVDGDADGAVGGDGPSAVKTLEAAVDGDGAPEALDVELG